MMDTIFWLIYVQPLYLVVVEMIFLTILWGLFKNKYGKRLWWKLFNSAIFVITVLAIIYSTIYSRTENFQTPIFIPFHSFLEAKENPELYRTIFMNMFLFAPFGLSLPNILPKKAHPVAATVIIAMLLSVSIEAIQYYLCLGRCEMDDVIFNSLGAFVGTLGFLLFEHLAKDLKNMKNNLTESQKILCNLCGNVLFDKNNNIPEDLDLGELFTEAKHQTVFPIAYMGLKKEKFEKSFYHFIK